MRVGDRLIVSVPGEMTEEMGRRVRDADPQADAGRRASTRIVISGLANEYLSYFTTPEEYDRQHYEGGSTLYGPLSSVFLQNQLGDLATRLTGGQPAPEPYPFDPTHGTTPDLTPYDQGAAAGTATTAARGRAPAPAGPLRVERRPEGLRPPARQAVRARSRSTRPATAGRRVADDLGLQVLWLVTGDGGYQATWEVPLDAPKGEYRFHITANRYELESGSFKVAPITDLSLRKITPRGGRPAVFVTYPPNHGLTADPPPKDPGALQGDGDQLSYHPTSLNGGKVTFRVGGKRVVVRRRLGPGFSVRAKRGAPVTVPAFGAHDAYGNTNAQPLKLR